MALKLGDVLPNFQADTTHGKIEFHDYIKGSWAILFSHPADFTPVVSSSMRTRPATGAVTSGTSLPECGVGDVAADCFNHCQVIHLNGPCCAIHCSRCERLQLSHVVQCTTELGAVGLRLEEFAKRGVKVLALSCDEVASHKG
eukprot:jgi/Chrzof1/3827/Cz13g10080.t1